jgi:hypothetical protein
MGDIFRISGHHRHIRGHECWAWESCPTYPGWLACRTLRTAYRLDVKEFRDARNVQLRIEYMESGEF